LFCQFNRCVNLIYIITIHYIQYLKAIGFNRFRDLSVKASQLIVDRDSGYHHRVVILPSFKCPASVAAVKPRLPLMPQSHTKKRNG
jgi:hypothetical protein